MKVGLVVSFAALCILMMAPVTFAHHWYAAYDNAKSVTLIGTVTDFEMANPHSSIKFDVKDEKVGRRVRLCAHFEGARLGT
jgi:hypothetical protein